MTGSKGKWLRTMLATMWAGWVVVAAAANIPSGDMVKWKTYRVEVDNQIVLFTIPPGMSRDFSDGPIPTRIDLTTPGQFDDIGRGPGLFTRHWDYGTDSAGHVDGTLTASIGINSSEEKLDGVGALRRAVEEGNKAFYSKMFRLEGRQRAPDFPTKFEQVSVAGREGLHVSFRVSPSVYVVPLDDHHFLEILLENSVSGLDWRKDAQAVSDGILKSIRIEVRD